MSNKKDAASVHETCNAINAACRAHGGAAATYSCKSVSWDDVQRGTVGGGLSCWGGNITDTRLWEKSGSLLYTCRPDNWNEKLGKVDANSIAVVVGNEVPGDKIDLKPITLADFLKKTGQYAAYTGVDRSTNLHDEQLDSEVSIRFQTTFLPIDDSDDKLGTLEFCTEAYNYNTHSDDDPRNAILLCTTQGIAFQQDGAGAKKLFHHTVDKSGSIHRHWLEAERSRHKVGGPQQESEKEALSAAARGKATASVIGIEAMGTRFNTLMTVQIPLQQKPKPTTSRLYKSKGAFPTSCSLSYTSASPCSYRAGVFLYKKSDRRGGGGTRARIGTSNAARVSRGSQVKGTWKGVENTKPKRDPHQHITVTVVIYNTVAGGVPSVEDVNAAIQDMEQLYAACAWTGKLAEKGADFMKSELTVAEACDIDKKITYQPYTPPKCGLVKNGSVFPRTGES